MSTEVTQQKRIRLARALAPEDIRPGDYVTLLHYVTEVLPLAALVDTTWQTPKPIAVQWLPWGGGMPVRVLGVCLPFVLVRDTDGDIRALDTRQHKLARVSKRFGKRAFDLTRKQRRRSKKDADDDDDE